MFQIEPFASLVNTVRSSVPRLLLNRHAVGPFEKVPLRRGDHMELGDLEVTVRRFAEMLGWNSEIEELIGTQETPVGSILRPNRYSWDFDASGGGGAVFSCTFQAIL